MADITDIDERAVTAMLEARMVVWLLLHTGPSAPSDQNCIITRPRMKAIDAIQGVLGPRTNPEQTVGIADYPLNIPGQTIVSGNFAE